MRVERKPRPLHRAAYKQEAVDIEYWLSIEAKLKENCGGKGNWRAGRSCHWGGSGMQRSGLAWSRKAPT